MNETKFLTCQDAANELGVSKADIFRWGKSGCFRLRRNTPRIGVFVERAELSDWTTTHEPEVEYARQKLRTKLAARNARAHQLEFDDLREESVGNHVDSKRTTRSNRAPRAKPAPAGGKKRRVTRKR